MALATGARLGPYEIVAPLGRGAMGEVYRAIDRRLDRPIAIKLLPSELAQSAARRQRFDREARALSTLRHAHICTLYDVGNHDGLPFLVLECVEGETLEHRLVRGPLPTAELLDIATEIADALEHAHRHGIIHRDLKPSNIVLTHDGVKLLDFGIAKLTASAVEPAGHGDPAGRPQTLTDDGAILGTVPYMAPEQLEGRQTDLRTDIFALGAVLYEMATGHNAFAAPSRAGMIAAILEHHPQRCSVVAPTVPPLLDPIVARCLAKSPADRWQSAGDVKAALRLIASGGVSERRAVRVGFARRSVWRRLAATIAAVMTLGSLAWVIITARRVPPEVRPLRFVVTPPVHTDFSQSSAFMALSPDGSTLAFIAGSGDDGTKRLWVRALETLSPRALPGTDGASRPFWSPDSRLVFFGIVGASERLNRIDVASGYSQPIVNSRAVPGDWSNAGVLLLPAGREQGGLYQMSANGGARRPVTTLDASRGETYHSWPQFLPDGRHFIFFARSAQQHYDGVIYAGSLDSSERARLVQADSHAVFAEPGFLLYMRVNTLIAQPFDPATLRLLGEPTPIAEQVESTPGSGRGAFTVSRTGVLAYRSMGETRLAWYDRNGKALQWLGTPGQYSNPALSPDEQRIAVDRLDVETGASDIWLFDLTRGGLAERLTFSPAPEIMPLWSRDGSRIVYRSTTTLYQKAMHENGKTEILRDNVPGPGIGPLGWSPDGQLIYYAQDAQRKLDVLMRALTPDAQPVAHLNGEFAEAQAQLSPDGRWIAYASNESGTFEVYARAFPSGEGKKRVSIRGGLEPQWRGDGQELFYLSSDRNLMSVAVRAGLTLEASLPTPLFETRMATVFDPSYTRNQYVVSADGNRFLINQPASGERPPPITVVVNWPALLKR
jgi:serine/threonine protein kinase/Tol biopolymer transport system component